MTKTKLKRRATYFIRKEELKPVRPNWAIFKALSDHFLQKQPKYQLPFKDYFAKNIIILVRNTVATFQGSFNSNMWSHWLRQKFVGETKIV